MFVCRDDNSDARMRCSTALPEAISTRFSKLRFNANFYLPENSQITHVVNQNVFQSNNKYCFINC